MKGEMVTKVRTAAPLIHCITNYVTVNDVANMILAAGGSPIMADGVQEAEDITGICQGLVLNIGTLNDRTIETMILAGKKAGDLGNVIVFDPVGAGASRFRTLTAFQILKDVKVSIIRGNISEIKTLAAGVGTTQGVDADMKDAVTEENLNESVAFAKNLSGETGAVIAITGAIDIVADFQNAFVVRNGHPMMSRVTGTGCTLDGVIAAYAASDMEHISEATAMAVAAQGLCGQMAHEKVMAAHSGTSSFRMHLIDAMSNLNDKKLNGGALIEIR